MEAALEEWAGLDRRTDFHELEGWNAQRRAHLPEETGYEPFFLTTGYEPFSLYEVTSPSLSQQVTSPSLSHQARSPSLSHQVTSPLLSHQVTSPSISNQITSPSLGCQRPSRSHLMPARYHQGPLNLRMACSLNPTLTLKPKA